MINDRQSENPSHSAQLFIARDIIDMARDYKTDSDILEYLSNFCFNLDRISETMNDKFVDWEKIFTVLDQAYSTNDQTLIANLDSTYATIAARIEDANKSKSEK